MKYHLILYVLLIFFALFSVMARSMLVSAISLAAASILTALIMFSFSAAWAAVFELSVCAGLITVLFISIISLVRKEEKFFNESRIRFQILPLVAALVAIVGWIFFIPFFEAISKYPYMTASGYNLGRIIWDIRSFDLVAQITVLAAGVFVIKSIFRKGDKKI